MRTAMKRENKKYWILGIIGCVLFGIGDWLLGYVDPAVVAEEFSVIKAGHGASYELAKIAVTVTIGAAGAPFLLLGCMRIAELVTEEGPRRRLRLTMTLLPVGWLIIHFTVSFGIFVYSWCMHRGDTAAAMELTLAVMDMDRGAQLISYLFAAIPLIQLVVYTVRGKTELKTSSLLFTPLLWMALLSGLKFVVPATRFTNGIDTFCMNAGMIVWFVYLLLIDGEKQR